MERPASIARGFTLIEMMVAVAIFTIVMLIAVGSLLSLVTVNARAESIHSVMNNLNAALETMARNIRTGQDYHCGSGGLITNPKDCQTGLKYFAYLPSGADPSDSSDRVVYYYDQNQSRIERCESNCVNNPQFISITAPEVTIDSMQFYVTGTTVCGSSQPRVLISIHGYAKVPGGTTEFRVQTGITQRVLSVCPSS